MRRFILATCLALTALPATAEERQDTSIWSLLSFDSVAQILFNSAIQSSRAFADVRYDQISFDPRTLRITLTNLDVSPYIEPGRDCDISAQRVILRGGALDRPDVSRFHTTFDGIEIGRGCLPLPAQMFLAQQKSTINIPHVSINMNYDLPRGSAEIQAMALLEDLATAELFVDVEYFSYRMDFASEKPMTAVDLTEATLTLSDQGAIALVRQLAPPQVTTPEAIEQFVRKAITDLIAPPNEDITNEDGTLVAPKLTEQQGTFVAQATQAARKLIEENAPVVITTGVHHPAAHVDLNDKQTAQKLFDLLKPSVGTTVPALQEALPVSLLSKGQRGQADSDTALKLGRAFVTGIGAPKNRAEALKQLEPLAETSPEAAYLLAQLYTDSETDIAYGHAIQAARENWPGALTLLDSLEQDLDYETLTEIQADIQQPLDNPPQTALDMGRLAAAYASGIGQPRSYRDAYYWSSMAAAAGNPTAAVQRDDLTEYFRLRGNAEHWLETLNDIEAEVLKDWIRLDLAQHTQ